jgi:DNA repair protein RadC
MPVKKYEKTIKGFRIVSEPTDIPVRKVDTSQLAADYARQFYLGDIDVYESFFIILLNRANNATSFAKISQGGTVGTVVDIKIIAKYAVEGLANGVILVHNHPSGNVAPSEADRRVTTKTKEALLLLDITLYDHVIISKDKHYSFADNGELY